MNLSPADVIVIVGKRGTGKSTWARTHLWTGARRKLAWTPYPKDFPSSRVMTFAEFMASPEVMDAADLSLCVVPSSVKPSICNAEFEQFADVLGADGGQGDFALFVDECRLLRPNPEPLDVLATQSRHYGEAYGEPGVPLVLLGQRAVHVPPDARDQATSMVMFRQDNPEDIDALGKRIGRARAARISQLSKEKHEHILWREEDGRED